MMYQKNLQGQDLMSAWEGSCPEHHMSMRLTHVGGFSEFRQNWTQAIARHDSEVTVWDEASKWIHGNEIGHLNYTCPAGCEVDLWALRGGDFTGYLTPPKLYVIHYERNGRRRSRVVVAGGVGKAREIANKMHRHILVVMPKEDAGRLYS